LCQQPPLKPLHFNINFLTTTNALLTANHRPAGINIHFPLRKHNSAKCNFAMEEDSLGDLCAPNKGGCEMVTVFPLSDCERLRERVSSSSTIQQHADRECNSMRQSTMIGHDDDLFFRYCRSPFFYLNKLSFQVVVGRNAMILVHVLRRIISEKSSTTVWTAEWCKPPENFSALHRSSMAQSFARLYYAILPAQSVVQRLCLHVVVSF